MKFIITLCILAGSISALGHECSLKLIPNLHSDLSLPTHEISEILREKGYDVEMVNADVGQIAGKYIEFGAFTQYVKRDYDEDTSDLQIGVQEWFSNLFGGKSVAYINFKITENEKARNERIITRIYTMTDAKAEINLKGMIDRRVLDCPSNIALISI